MGDASLNERAEDRRSADRARTRLRPGKLLDGDGRFVADCAILDRSPAGVRIRCFAPIALPDGCRLLDEADGTNFPVSPIWQKSVEAGLRQCGPATRMARRDHLRVAGPYYAVR